LDLQGGTFKNLDLTGTRIKGELNLGSGKDHISTWGINSEMLLRNTMVDTFQVPDDLKVWPDRIDLNGFSYNASWYMLLINYAFNSFVDGKLTDKVTSI
jgi:hypothetical protein